MKIKLVLLFVTLFISTHLFAQPGFPFAEKKHVFKKQNSFHFLPSNGILFIGSSSFRKWPDLEKRFADNPVVKLGVRRCETDQILDSYTPYICYFLINGE